MAASISRYAILQLLARRSGEVRLQRERKVSLTDTRAGIRRSSVGQPAHSYVLGLLPIKLREVRSSSASRRLAISSRLLMLVV